LAAVVSGASVVAAAVVVAGSTDVSVF